MSSSGKGSYFIRGREDIEKAINAARYETRGSGEMAIIEEYVPVDTKVTELAVRHPDEDGGGIVTTFPKPIGHYQIDGDYHSSWQSPNVAERMGIALAMGANAFDAKRKAEVAAHKILIRTAAEREWRGQEERRMHVV